MNETITLFRRGFFVTENFTLTQCATEGHEAYTYQATMLCDYKLDDLGFIVDHTLIHQQIDEYIINNPMYSCEVMSRQLAHLVTDFMLREGCALKEIQFTIIPVKRAQLKREGNNWVAKNPLTINYNMPANAIYKLVVDNSFETDVKATLKKVTPVTHNNAVVGLRVVKGEYWEDSNYKIEEDEVGTIIKTRNYYPENSNLDYVQVLWDNTGFSEDIYCIKSSSHELSVAPQQ